MALLENIDMIAEREWSEESDEPFQGPVDSDARLKADSLANRACLANNGLVAERGVCACEGILRLGLGQLGPKLSFASAVTVVGVGSDDNSEVRATGSCELLFERINVGS